MRADGIDAGAPPAALLIAHQCDMQSPANLARTETLKVTRGLDQERIALGDGLQGLRRALAAIVGRQ